MLSQSVIFVILFSVMATQSAVLLCVLLSKKMSSKLPNILLSVVIFSVTFSAFIYTLALTGTIRDYPFLVNSQLPFTYIMPGALYLYVCALTEPEFHFKEKSFLIFAPAILAVAISMPLYLSANEIKANFFYSDSYYNIRIMQFLGGSLFLGVFLLLCFLKLREFTRRLHAHFSSLDHLRLVWLKTLLGALVLMWAVSLANLILFKDSLILNSMHSVVFCFVVYSIGYFALKRTEVFQLASASMKYQKTVLEPDKLQEILQKLDVHMKQNKPYLNSLLKLDDLAGQLRIPSHTLSQAINSGFNKNFFDYVNSYRIDEAIAKINQIDHSNSTLLSICYDVGFNSKSTFNAAFKKMTGKTPSQYRQ